MVSEVVGLTVRFTTKSALLYGKDNCIFLRQKSVQDRAGELAWWLRASFCFKGSRFDSEDSNKGSPLAWTPSTHMWYTEAHAVKTVIHIK